MFGHKKKVPKSSLIALIQTGELSIIDAQALLNVRKMEAEVNDSENTTRDHSNLVDLRNTWGKVILGILLATIVSDFILVFMVGTARWKFEGNPAFLNVVATQHLAQIFGLVLIVLKSLFPKENK